MSMGDRFEDTVDEAKSKLGSAAESARKTASEVGERARETLSSENLSRGREQAARSAEQIRDLAGKAKAKAKDAAKDAAKHARKPGADHRQDPDKHSAAGK